MYIFAGISLSLLGKLPTLVRMIERVLQRARSLFFVSVAVFEEPRRKCESPPKKLPNHIPVRFDFSENPYSEP